MSVYSVNGKGWRVDFELNKQRHSSAWHKTKTLAKQAESSLRKELSQTQTQIDMGFLTLLNLKLDNVANYRSTKYYSDFHYMAKRWTQQWGELNCSEINREMVEQFVLSRKKAKVSPHSKQRDSLLAKRVQPRHKEA